MRKQLFKTAVATATALSIAVMPALTVCAEDYSEPIHAYGEDIEIDGDVNLSLDADHKDVNCGVDASRGNITISGDLVIDNENHKMHAGVGASEGNIEIGGDCTYKNGGEDFYAITTGSNANIIINGSLNSDTGGMFDYLSDFYVGGDVNAKTDGLVMYGYGDNNENHCIINGTIHTEEGSALVLSSMTYPGRDCETVVNAHPKVVVYAFNTPDDVPLVDVSRVSFNGPVAKEEQAQELTELFTAAINYIIHTEGGEIALSGEDLVTAEDFGIDDPDKDFTATQLGKTFTATVGSDYALEGNSCVEVTKISDGVYSVKLIDEKGGILLTATALSAEPGPGQDDPVVIIIPDTTPSSSSGSDSQSGSSESSTASYSDIPAGAVTVSLARSSAPTAAAGAGPAVLGATREPSRSVAIRVGQLTGAQFKQTIINNINATPAGGMLRIETDKIACFDKAILEAFAKKGNIDMEVVFPIGSQKMNVTIPAGYDASKLLDKKGYCGFLNLLAVFGTETEE